MEKIWILENKTCNTGQVLIDGKWQIVAPASTIKLEKEPLHFTANLRKIETFRQGKSSVKVPGRKGNEESEVIQASSELEVKKE